MSERPKAVVTWEGPESLCTSGKDRALALEVDATGNVVGAHFTVRAGAYQAPQGIAIDPAEWCEPSHATCDCNPDTPLPGDRWVEWQYGAHPMRTNDRRPPQFCVACFEMALGEGWDDLYDWRTIEQLRAEARAQREAA